MSYAAFKREHVIGVWSNVDEGGSRIVVFLDNGEHVSVQCANSDIAAKLVTDVRGKLHGKIVEVRGFE